MEEGEKAVTNEAETQGYAGRFGAGLPRINDGSFLFLSMIAKMKPPRMAVVVSPSCSTARRCSPATLARARARSAAGSSRTTGWRLVGLPDQLFYNTGINTYIWIVTNKKPSARQGKIQLINATGLFERCASRWVTSATT